jgi:glucose dehydrogenase
MSATTRVSPARVVFTAMVLLAYLGVLFLIAVVFTVLIFADDMIFWRRIVAACFAFGLLSFATNATALWAINFHFFDRQQSLS